MCGLLGYVGTEPADITKIKLLLALNKSRGKDSFGICISNNIQRQLGIYENQKNSNFINYPDEIENNTIVGHTRASTIGKVNLNNAHPFDFLYKKNKLILDAPKTFNRIGAHNGTIENWKELKEKYKLSSDYDMDSKVLTGIIFQENNFKVLQEYKGAAALMLTNIDIENSLTIWKGAAGNIEERPLHYIKRIVNDEVVGYYISSLKCHLEFICDNKELEVKNIKSVKNNELIIFKEGKLFKSYILNRNESLKKTTHKATNLNKAIEKNFILTDEIRTLLKDLPLRLNRELRYIYNNKYLTGSFIYENNKLISSNSPKSLKFKDGVIVNPKFYELYKDGPVSSVFLQRNCLSPFLNTNYLKKGVHFFNGDYTYPFIGLKVKVSLGDLIEYDIETIKNADSSDNDLKQDDYYRNQYYEDKALLIELIEDFVEDNINNPYSIQDSSFNKMQTLLYESSYNN